MLILVGKNWWLDENFAFNNNKLTNDQPMNCAWQHAPVGNDKSSAHLPQLAMVMVGISYLVVAIP